MATVSFLWHLHQPGYRTADGVAHAPWVALHAGGAYTTLAKAIADQGGRGQVLNLVPTLVEQLEAYRDGTVRDPVIDALCEPASQLGGEERGTLLDWAFHVSPRQMARFPRLRELASRREAVGSAEHRLASFGLADLRDLQVLTILTQAGEQAWTDERLAGLLDKGRHFSGDDHEAAARWLQAQPGELLTLWRELADRDGVEIATSPFAHPIMPLLADTSVVRDSWAPHPAPKVPLLRHPDDAAWQLDRGLDFMRQRGFEPHGCWPPEGSVSAEAVAIYADAGVQWLVTDEGILERSLGKSLRSGDHTASELYRPWKLDGPCPTLFFRDRWLSDEIGFVFGHWEDEAQAAGAFVDHLRGLARQLPPEATIVIALDGENPWLHYPKCGGTFLRQLMAGLNQHSDELEPRTLAEVTGRSKPDTLAHLHPGSWINGVFATWIGHPEKTRAWEVLAAVREALPDGPDALPPSLLLAEGSDWFWWLGDDNPTALAPLYDTIFRRHLGDVCTQAGIDPPVDLEQPLKTLTHPIRVPISQQWPTPVLDGRITTYFEWSLAAWIRAAEAGPLQRLALWGGHDRLHILIEGEQPIHQLTEDDHLRIHLHSPDGAVLSARVGALGCEHGDVDCGVGRVAELSLPWSGGEGYRLEIRLGSQQLPEGAAILLEPDPVDGETNR